MEQWVEYLTSDDYEYSSLYSGRREVLNNLLCTIGTGYDYINGYIIMTASGADQNISLYGEWEKAKFAPKIQKVVDRVMAWEGLSEVLDKHEEIVTVHRKTKEDKDIKTFGMPYKEWCKITKNLELLSDYLPTKEYQRYYPISDYSNITKFDENTHPSYIKAGIEVCEEIIIHKSEEREENVKFAKTFLAKFKKKTFEEFKKELITMVHKTENSFRQLRSKEPIDIEEIEDGIEHVDQETLRAYFRSGDTVYSTMVGMGLSNSK